MKFDFDKNFKQLILDRGLGTVLILGHMNPDGDCAGCVLGLAHYIRVNYPECKVLPYLAETLDRGVKKQVEEDEWFDPFQKPQPGSSPYAVIVCDTATKARIIGQEYLEQAAVSLVLDHHVSNERYGDMNYVEVSEACAENLYDMLDPDCLRKAAAAESYPNGADYLYLGILHDTGCFARAQKTTLRAAWELAEMGADHRRVMRTMYADTLADLQKKGFLFGKARKAFGGKAAYIVMDQKEILQTGISYDDIHPVSGMLRDCEDISLAFTVYEEEPDLWRCSFRSDGVWIDVNELLAPLGGGGHKSAAGLRKRTDSPEKLLDALFAGIGRLTGEK